MTERTALHQLLSPGGLRPYFQPIVDSLAPTPSLFSVECLVRGPVGTNMESPNVLFDYIRFKGEELRIDRACVKTVLSASVFLQQQPRFSFNVHACTLGRDDRFVDFLASEISNAGISSSRVTVEIVEHAPPYDGDAFRVALQRLRDLGFSIALDDVGLGQSNFKMIVDVRPDYLKIDRYFVTGISNDPIRQAVVGAIAHLAFRFGAGMIAEGVETEEDLSTINSFGIGLVQGYLYAQPMPAERFSATVRDFRTTPNRHAASAS
jgi:EAL domain-containing protein (putative c-di-GMP-specific phosphodiesterase class I)